MNERREKKQDEMLAIAINVNDLNLKYFVVRELVVRCVRAAAKKWANGWAKCC